MTVKDSLGRPLRNLRISVTDRCNLRCSYCMPEEEYRWLEHGDLLRFEEIGVLARAFVELGVTKFRLTGGEPLLRRDLHRLVSMLAELDGADEVAMTTNGVLLDQQAVALHAAGLDRLTVSLDTLRPDRFRELTRRDDLERVLGGLAAADAAGFQGTKLNTVVMRGVNDDELPAILELARQGGYEARFIEYMDVGGATRWSETQVVPQDEILQRIAAEHGAIEPLPGRGSAPADRFRLADGTVFGVIASTTRPFCAACDRSRLTADGQWYLCLYAATGHDLRGPLRAGASPAELTELLRSTWAPRTDQGAVDREAHPQRGTFVPLVDLRRDPHLEMHTRGG